MSNRVAVDELLAAAARYEKDAEIMGQTFSRWPDRQRAKAEECRKAARYLLGKFYPSAPIKEPHS